MQIVIEKVRPERLTESNALRREKWWQFERHAKNLYRALQGLSRCLVTPEVAKHLIFVWQPSNIVFASTCNVVASDKPEFFAILQSSVHEAWARREGLSRLETRPRYNPTLCYSTFAFPVSILSNRMSDLAEISVEYESHRSEICKLNQEGLTLLYNRFHDPDETSPNIQKLRQLHVEMDHAVAAAYGWTDLDLGHGFHQTKQGLRYTISEPARREVLARLLKLNHERYAEEVRQGLHEKRKPKAGKSRKKTADTETQAVLFREEDA